MVDTPLHIHAHEDALFYGRIRARSRLREAAFSQAVANEPIAR